MGRPARPRVEAEAIAAAAEQVRLETRLRAVEPVAREIARRVLGELLADLRRDQFEAALANIARQQCPFFRLATDPAIDTASAFADRRVERLRARGGRYLSSGEQLAERRQLAAELEGMLTRRYQRHLGAQLKQASTIE